MDLLKLATDENEGRRLAPQPVLKRLRSSHHAAAQYLVAGRTIRETAALVGRTPQSISDLSRNDPAFQELMAYYSDQRTETQISDTQRVQAKLLDIAELATDEISDRLEDPAKLATIPVGELRQIAALGLDRTVAPPKTAVPAQVVPTHITFNMGTRDLRPKDDEILTISNDEVKPEPK